MADAGDPEQGGGMEDVRADDLLRRQRVDQQHRQPEERPRADGRQPDHEAANRADQNRDHPVPPAEQERRIVGAPRNERLREETGASEDQRTPHNASHRRIRPVAKAAGDLHADE